MNRVLQSIGAIMGILLFTSPVFAAENSVNVYAWSGEIPESLIQQFEKETGIKVNFSTYDSNEVLYSKLLASDNPGYDIVEPSTYYIDRMSHQGMLELLDKSKLIGFDNLDPQFLNQSYDPHNGYSIPYLWGATGIFVNTDYYSPSSITKWSDLWNPKYEDQLLLLDDSRDVFSMALFTEGYSPNDTKPQHLEKAYQKLRALAPNIKLYKSDGVITLLIDEDVTVGMAWNGDVYKAKKENSKLAFIYPSDGFVIWVDSFAIPKNAPHLDNAYRFLNFMLRATNGKTASLWSGYPTTNLASKKLLPPDVRNNPMIYPSRTVMRRGKFQNDMDDASLELYEKYWEKLKMEG